MKGDPQILVACRNCLYQTKGRSLESHGNSVIRHVALPLSLTASGEIGGETNRSDHSDLVGTRRLGQIS